MLEGHCYTSGNVGVPEGFKIRSIKPDPGAQPLSIFSIVNLELIFPVGFLCRFWAPREHGCGKPYQASAQINGDGMANTDEYEVAVNKYITRMSCRKG